VNLDPLLRTIGADAAVDAWSVYASDTRRVSLGIKDREIGNAHAPYTMVEGSAARYLIVWSDGRVSRGNFERRQFEEAPAQALAAARAAAYDDPDAAQVLGPAEFPEVRLHDPAAAAVASGDGARLSARLGWLRERVDAWEVETWSGSFGAAETRARLVTSAGLDVSGEGTTFGWHVTLDGEIGDGHGARAPESEGSFRSRMERLARTRRELARDAEPMEGGVHPLILHPDVVERLVLATLLHNLDGATVEHGEGRFRREQFGSGDAVLREDLTLRLDPLQPLRSGSYRFTSEGLPAARCTFIESGRLVQPLLDLKYARRLGLPPTPIPYDSDVLHLEGPQRLSFADACDRVGRGALVLSVLGLHTQDRGSGDFSLSAPQVLALGASGAAGSLRATFSGNLFDLLQDEATRLVEFEDEHTPGLLVRCRLDPK
jgi:PmbA protein